nr:uncharacterized protein LOC116155355 isoform X2 [Camelus dromedarius]
MSARVCVCMRDGDRAELCASACAGASVRRSVRSALRPALRARSLAQPPHQICWGRGVAGADAGSARHPQPRLRPAPGRACAASRELRRARGADGRGGRGAPAAPRAREGPNHRPLIPNPDLGRPHPPTSLGVPAGAAPALRLPGQGRRGSGSTASISFMIFSSWEPRAWAAPLRQPPEGPRRGSARSTRCRTDRQAYREYNILMGRRPCLVQSLMDPEGRGKCLVYSRDGRLWLRNQNDSQSMVTQPWGAGGLDQA